MNEHMSEDRLRAERDQKLFQVLRQSNKLRNPRRSRRAITATGKPKSPEWPLEELALLGTLPDAVLAKRFNRPDWVVRSKRLQLGQPEPLETARS